LDARDSCESKVAFKIKFELHDAFRKPFRLPAGSAIARSLKLFPSGIRLKNQQARPV
jgi:hypothetical protein